MEAQVCFWFRLHQDHVVIAPINLSLKIFYFLELTTTGPMELLKVEEQELEVWVGLRITKSQEEGEEEWMNITLCDHLLQIKIVQTQKSSAG